MLAGGSWRHEPLRGAMKAEIAVFATEKEN